MQAVPRGVFAPVLTPFNANDGAPDRASFLNHCRWLVANGAGLALFGTNSEAASLSVGERIELTDALIDSGVDASKLMPGTGACSITDAVTLTRHALSHQVPGVLVIPPFFFKGIGDDGLFAYYSELIERVGDERLSVYLYHIPQFSHAPISLGLIERLLKRYPKSIAGAKDSSGNWDNTKAMIDNFASQGFAVFPASESFLSRALPLGAAGCISATVNMNPAGIRALYEGWSTPQGPALQAQADQVRGIFQATAMIPAMKGVLANVSGLPSWAIVRPPLTQMEDVDTAILMQNLSSAGWSMPGYAGVGSTAKSTDGRVAA